MMWTKLGLEFLSRHPAFHIVMDDTVKIERLGRFKVIGTLGQGAMGIVYKAVDEVIDRTVAIKTLRLGQDLSEAQIAEFKHRFRLEAQLAGKLSHPNVVTIYDVGEAGDLSYIAMEFVDGKTLEYLIAHQPPNWESLQSIEFMMEVMLQTCDGLNFAHEQNVTHRDIKPANIIISKNGHVKIMDFGIAKISSSTGTAVGTIIGTPGYMSPEQIAGRTVDERSDIFSLGTVFYELLTGKKAFTGNNITEVMYKVMNENPTPVQVVNPLIPPVFDNIISRSLRRNADERYRSVDLMARDIRKIKQTIQLSRTIYVDGDLVGPHDTVPFLQRLGIKDLRKVILGLSAYGLLMTVLMVVAFWTGGGRFDRIARSLTSVQPASMRLAVNVPDAEIFLDDTRLANRGGSVRLDTVTVGEHKLTIRREGYETYQTALVFGVGESKDVNATLLLAPSEIPANVDTSYLTVTSDPPMARVETSTGRFVGYTPFEEHMFPGGKYTLLIHRPDHFTSKRDVSLRRNRVSSIDVRLEKHKGTVSLEGLQPAGASLFVHNRALPRTGRGNAYRISVGEQVVTVKADGYVPVEKKLTIVRDSTILLTDSLSPTFGMLWVKSNPSGAEVFLNGTDRSVGRTPFLAGPLVAHGHTVKLSLRSESRARQVRVVQNDTTEVLVTFSRPNGYLDVVTEPPGATLFINTIRERDFQSPGLLEIKPGWYKIRLSHPNYRKFYETTMKVRPEQVVKIIHRFE
jgi:tRNA A-37 threonylcarbamoyl transferase component Bud32